MRYFLAALLLAGFTVCAQTAIVDSHTRCLLGGWDGKGWTATPQLDGDRVYNIYGAADGSAISELTGHPPRPIEGPCGGSLEIPFDHELPEGSVAVSGPAKLFAFESLPVTSRSYISAFRALLNAQGVRSAVRIEQLLRVDLDGDGKMETLASLYSVREPGPESSPGDYSAIVMRRVDEHDHLTTQIVDFEKHPREGGVTHMTIGPILDLNGDGRAEVVIRGQYTKGRYSHVYQLVKGKLVRVLECTCGE
ncbi:MAG TPA: hypothetical protein VGL53_07085 [Bryobacteraceae bacterium]|jgi:hypothetical protein